MWWPCIVRKPGFGGVGRVLEKKKEIYTKREGEKKSALAVTLSSACGLMQNAYAHTDAMRLQGKSVRVCGSSLSSPHRTGRSRDAALTRRRRRHGTNARHASRRPGHSAGGPGPTRSSVSRGGARRAPSSSITTERACRGSRLVFDEFHGLDFRL